MQQRTSKTLSRRERQIMDIVYERSQCSAREIHEQLQDAPSYSAVRALLSILVEKGHLQYRQTGARYHYSPARPIAEARQSATQRLIKTFFRGSTGDAVNALIGTDASQLSDDELDALSELIEQARKKRE